MNRWRQIVIGVVAVGALGVVGLTPASGSTPTTAPPNGPAAAPAFAPAVTAPTVQETVYVPIVPCRIVDTRNGTGVGHTPLGNGATRAYYVGGTTNFLGQGGTSGGCGIPIGASAITATITAITPSNPGFMRAWPVGSAAPNATVLSYQKFSIGTGTTLSLGTGAQSLNVKNFGGPSGLVIDVSGYYVTQMAAYLQGTGTLTYATSRVVSTTHSSTGNYEVTFSRDISRCAYQVTPFQYNWVAAVGSAGANTLHVYIHDQVSPYTAHDTSFYVTVTC